MPDPITIDGFGPLPVLRPTSGAELGDAIRGAAAVYPFGGQTHLGVGMPPAKSGVAIDLRGLNGVIDFPARDMTITVQAGIAIKTLQELLAPENLRLPIDVPRAGDATLGGILATNVSGWRRFGYGTLRDYVIGIHAYNDDGQEFKAGGRVVKNVAGYDLCKLLVGSMGTLGVINQVTLKLRPRAEEKALLTVPCTTEQIGPLVDKLMASRTRPVVLDVVNRAAATQVYGAAGHACADAAWLVLVGYEGNSDAVKWQMQHIVKELGTSYAMDVRIGCTNQSLDVAMADWPLVPDAKLTFKATMFSSAVAEFLTRIERIGQNPALRAHAGNGVVVGHYAGDLTLAAAKELLAGWRAAAITVVPRAPSDWKRDLDVWGPLPKDIDVMRRVKAIFDSRGVFNPGRFVQGL